MRAARTRLGLLLQARREAAGYSRTRLGELVDVPAGTIEGWEIGRVAKPPIHDVLKVARVLRIPVAEIEAAVLEPEQAPTKPLHGQPDVASGAAPLLEQAIELFGWTEEQAAAALQTSAARVRAWRRGTRGMTLPEVMTVAALIALRAVGGASPTTGPDETADQLAKAAVALAKPGRA